MPSSDNGKNVEKKYTQITKRVAVSPATDKPFEWRPDLLTGEDALTHVPSAKKKGLSVNSRLVLLFCGEVSSSSVHLVPNYHLAGDPLELHQGPQGVPGPLVENH